jgi:hypothetical protein
VSDERRGRRGRFGGLPGAIRVAAQEGFRRTELIAVMAYSGDRAG